VRDAIDDYSNVPELCQGNNVLVLDTRFGADRYHPLFIVQLLCRRLDMDIYIRDLSITRELAAEKFKEFDIVVRDRGNDIDVVRHRTDP
jgi:hypothetical protein